MGEKRLEEACVNDERKTKKELIAELEGLRKQVEIFADEEKAMVGW
jgi:hypothetical protein